MNPSAQPQTFDALVERTQTYRDEILRNSKGRRWCWINEWSESEQVYWLGVKYEGMTTWVKYSVLQEGYGPLAYEWIERLNGMEGISPDEHRKIWQSGRTEARACLSDDEENVVLLLRGVAHDRTSQGQYSFLVEYVIALDLFLCLHKITRAFRLPFPSEGMDTFRVTMDDDSGDVRFVIPGEYEQDPHDEYVFSLTLSLQEASDLMYTMPVDFFCEAALLEENALEE